MENPAAPQAPDSSCLEPEFPNSYQLETKVTLRLKCCGLVLKFSNCTLGDGVEPHQVYQALDTANGSLSYWANNRAQRHRCELVTESNPMGLTPLVTSQPDVE